MKIGIVSELTGGADICQTVEKLEMVQANSYLRPNEIVLFAFGAAKEEYAFTNEALITIKGESAISSKRLVERYEYANHPISRLKFETAGMADRDCELKFQMGPTLSISIDIIKADEKQAQLYYRILLAISQEQARNARLWEFTKLALETTSRSMHLSDANGKSIAEIAAQTQQWLLEMHDKCNPICYKYVVDPFLKH